MRNMIPLYKIPRVAAVFSLVKASCRYVCLSCQSEQGHWFGYVDSDTCNPHVYICLRCGQASKSDKDNAQSYHSIRIEVGTPAEARAVRAILRGRTDLWGGAMYFCSNGVIHMQWGSWSQQPIDDLTNALRSAGFGATWEKERTV